MVLRDLFNFTLPDAVAAAVTDVSDVDHAVGCEVRGNDGGAHALSFFVASSGAYDLVVGFADGEDESGTSGVEVGELGQCVAWIPEHVGGLEESFDGSGGKLARDITSAVTAHPIGDEVQTEVGAFEHGVFVVLSAASDIGNGGATETCGLGFGGLNAGGIGHEQFVRHRESGRSPVRIAEPSARICVRREHSATSVRGVGTCCYRDGVGPATCDVFHDTFAAMNKVHPTATATVPRAAPPKIETATYVLTVVDGPDDGQRFVLDGSAPSRILVGTSPACDIRLKDALVSRRHAGIEQKGRRLRLSDMGSTNGTFVNGVEIVEAWLGGSELVLMGETTFRVTKSVDARTAFLTSATSFGNVVGASEEMRKLYPLCERLAQSNVPVIIEGETGTGKEVLAESLHQQGPRAKGPYVVFDCTATPPNLMESALFGHEKGAFTGATDARAGVFEQANGGTLLLDEIGDLDINLQPKLLRVIQSMEIQRVGGSRRRKVDVRVLAATRRDLDREVQAGRFRDDLFYRLAVARIELPPLRRRTGDISLLATYFWNADSLDRPIPVDLLQKLEDYEWPGNVRELRNVVSRHQALGDLALFEKPSEVGTPTEENAAIVQDPIDDVVYKLLPLSEARQEIIQVFEKRYLEHVLALHDGNVTRAAATAGVARRYFHLLRAKYSGKDSSQTE